MAWVVGLIIPIALRAVIGEPEVAVGARRDPTGTGIGGGDGELGDDVGRRVDLTDLGSPLSSVNQRLPSGPAVIPFGPGIWRVGTGNSVMAWVVGLISPILLPPSLGEPEVAVGARRDPAGSVVGRGRGNSVIDSRQRSSSPSTRDRTGSRRGAAGAASVSPRQGEPQTGEVFMNLR